MYCDGPEVSNARKRYLESEVRRSGHTRPRLALMNVPKGEHIHKFSRHEVMSSLILTCELHPHTRVSGCLGVRQDRG